MRGLLLDATPLRGREFRLLFLGQLISFFGSMITFVALPFQMYELTGSAIVMAALLANSLLDEPHASFAGVRTSIVSGGVMCVVGTVVILAFLPALWRYDARRPAPREEAPAGSAGSY